MKVFDHNNAGNTCEIFLGLFKIELFTLILCFLFGTLCCQSIDHFYDFFTMTFFDHNNAGNTCEITVFFQFI